jgi:multidrug efflux pump subunit AcrB
VPREQLPFSKRGGPYSSRRCFIAERKALRGLLVAANQDPRLASVFSTFSATNPSLYLDIDRDKAQVLGVDISSIFQALQASLGSYYVNDMNLFGRTWQVQGQAEAEDRASVDDIYRIHVRNSKGEMIPLRSLVETRVVVGPQGWPSPVQGSPAPE